MKTKSTLRKAAIFVPVLILVTSDSFAQRNIQRMQDPHVMKAVAPIYPLMALSARVRGVVTIEVQINHDGTVSSSNVITGPLLLRAVAERAASRWQFNAVDDAELRKAQLMFAFSIMPDAALEEDLVPIFLTPNRFEIKAKRPQIIPRVDSDPPMRRKKRRNAGQAFDSSIRIPCKLW